MYNLLNKLLKMIFAAQMAEERIKFVSTVFDSNMITTMLPDHLLRGLIKYRLSTSFICEYVCNSDLSEIGTPLV